MSERDRPGGGDMGTLRSPAATVVEAVDPAKGASVFRRLRADPAARVGLVIVGLFVAMAVLGPELASRDPLEVTVDRLQGPSRRHPLGTDGLGRDLLSRILHGSRLSLGTAVLTSALVTVIGVLVGTVSGFAGGLVDRLCMRLVDVVLTVPGLILALAVTGMFKPSLRAVMLGLVTIVWAGYARIVRGLVLTMKERPFVEAARAAGAGPTRVVTRHVLPNMISPVVVLATIEIGQLLLAISTLTFLGLGAPPPTPEWGAMLNDGRTYFLSDPHVVLIPGLTISLAVLGFNLVGDGVRDALDPRLLGERRLSLFRRRASAVRQRLDAQGRAGG